MPQMAPMSWLLVALLAYLSFSFLIAQIFFMSAFMFNFNFKFKMNLNKADLFKW